MTSEAFNTKLAELIALCNRPIFDAQRFEQILRQAILPNKDLYSFQPNVRAEPCFFRLVSAACYHDITEQKAIELIELCQQCGDDLRRKDIDKETLLHWAVHYNLTQIAFYAIGQVKIDVNAPGSYGRTPLHTAAWQGSFECLRLLLDKGADIHAKNDSGKRPIDLAEQEGFAARKSIILYLTAYEQLLARPKEPISKKPSLFKRLNLFKPKLRKKPCDLLLREATTPTSPAATQPLLKHQEGLVQDYGPVARLLK